MAIAERVHFQFNIILGRIQKIMLKEFAPIREGQSQEKILSYEQARQKIQEFRQGGLRVILAQGILDIVHIGHVEYLRAAKDAGNLLFVGIENDETVRLNKGRNRPFNNLDERLEFLTEFQSVDFVFGFENIPNYDQDVDLYTQRFRELSPTAIAVSSWDPNIDLKKKEANDARVELVIIDHGKRNSTTRLLEMIGYE